MDIVIILFGVFIIVAGFFLLVKPAILFSYLTHESSNVTLHIVAVAVRLLLGVALIVAAGGSKHPAVVETLGWFTIAAAVALVVMGRKNFQRLLEWGVRTLESRSFPVALVAIAIGGFLVYAFV